MKLSIRMITIGMVSVLFSLLTSCFDQKVSPDSIYYYYSWNKKKVYFKSTKIYHTYIPIPTKFERKEMNADAKTFEVISEIFAKDKNHVFKWNGIIDSVDAPTFVKISDDLFKDKYHVFKESIYGLQKIEGADPDTYRYFKGEYGLAKDKNGYFFREVSLDVDTLSFELITGLADRGYDKNHVYLFRNDISKYPIHGKLTKINDNLLYDDDQIFLFRRHDKLMLTLLSYTKREDFTIYAADKNTILIANDTLYWNNYLIDNIDISSFEYLGDSYAKDKKSVYLALDSDVKNVSTLAGADPKTFTYLGDYLAYDKNHVYVENVMLDAADPQSIKRVSEDLIVDKNNSWKRIKGKGWVKE